MNWIEMSDGRSYALMVPGGFIIRTLCIDEVNDEIVNQSMVFVPCVDQVGGNWIRKNAGQTKERRTEKWRNNNPHR